MATADLSVEDCTCPICMCIFIEPVTMPCTHTLCMPCFDENVHKASLTCPLCRTRISVWARRAANSGTLVDTKLWKKVKKLFPEKVEKRLAGDEAEDENEFVYQPIISLAEPGEIRKEYEEEMKKLEEQREIERQKEAEASEALIKKIQEEEKARQKELKIIEQKDEELAEKLANAPSSETKEEKFINLRSNSVSSTSSATANCRPASTIESFLNKMKVAEKMKEADRSMGSPNPYMCYTPDNSDNVKSLVEMTPNPLSVPSGNQTCKSRDCSSLGLKLDCDQVPIFDELDNLPASRASNRSETGSRCLHDLDHPNTFSTAAHTSRPVKPKTETAARALDLSEHHVTNTADADEHESSLNPKKEAKNNRVGSAQSEDSISQEMCHFKPIHSCPLTPPRQLPGGKYHDPPIIRTTPRNLSKSSQLGSPSGEISLSDIDAGSPIMKRRLSQLEEERKNNVKKFSKCTNTSGSEKGKKENYVQEEMLPSGDQSGKKTVGIGNYLDNNNEIDKVVLKNLVIPLEANLEEIVDCDVPPPLSVNNNITNLDSDSSNSSSARIKKFKASKMNKSRKHLEQSVKGSPVTVQRRIEDWMIKGHKPLQSSQRIEDVAKEALQLIGTGRDEVDGDLNTAKATCIGKKSRDTVHLKMTGALDRFVKKIDINSDSAREEESEDSTERPKKKVKHKHHLGKHPKRRKCSDLNSSGEKDTDSLNLMEQSNDDMSECESDSEIILTSCPYSPSNDRVKHKKKRKKHSEAESSSQISKRRKTSQSSHKISQQSKKDLRSCRTSKSSKHSQRKLQHNSESRKTKILFNMLQHSKLKKDDSKQNKLHLHFADSLAEANIKLKPQNLDDEMETYVDTLRKQQEEADKQLALKLAKQFEMEAKCLVDRSKGGNNEYELRHKSSRTDSFS